VRASAHRNDLFDHEQRPARRPRRCWRTTTRPLHIQRLAATLVARTHGLHRGHIGAICDALTQAGIDPAVWSAGAITDALEADMRARGTTWPDRIANPGAFLASRLRPLSWTHPTRDTASDSHEPRKVHQPNDIPDTNPHGTTTATPVPVAAAATRAAAKAYFQQHRARGSGSPSNQSGHVDGPGASQKKDTATDVTTTLRAALRNDVAENAQLVAD
jgi:hypothetical protein